MRRREFIKLISRAAIAWPISARSQQAVPVIGFLRPTRAEESGHLIAAFRQGLRESGYSGDKIIVEARWADGNPERIPKLAAELISLPVAVMFGNAGVALAAKKITTTTPIVFVTGVDPVLAGVVSNIKRPGANVTGVSFNDVPITGKRLALLREMAPKAEIIAVLQDPNFFVAEAETREVETAARALGQKIITVKAGSEQEIGTTSVRLFVAFYKNLPIDLTTDTFIPEQAAAILKVHGLTTEQSAYLETHTTILASSAGTALEVESTSEASSTVTLETTERLVKGKTTFGELVNWGLSKAAIEQILGMSMADIPSTALKDFCSANNLNFETIKTALQAEVDKLK